VDGCEKENGGRWGRELENEEKEITGMDVSGDARGEKCGDELVLRETRNR